MLIYYILIIISFLVSCLTLAAIFEKDIFNKILYSNCITSLGALFICLLGSFKANSSYIDIALIYILLSFAASLAYLRYFQYKYKMNL